MKLIVEVPDPDLSGLDDEGIEFALNVRRSVVQTELSRRYPDGKVTVLIDDRPDSLRIWRCPKCPWHETQHPSYPWDKHNERAVEIHRTYLCPHRDK